MSLKNQCCNPLSSKLLFSVCLLLFYLEKETISFKHSYIKNERGKEAVVLTNCVFGTGCRNPVQFAGDSVGFARMIGMMSSSSLGTLLGKY